MINDVINKAYTDDKPYSFGGKHRLYEAYTKENVDKANKSLNSLLALRKT